ncbi:MAG: S41 family peptidase [Anaerolineales bacterium]|jgi:carboxyl-terminal processing protease
MKRGYQVLLFVGGGLFLVALGVVAGVAGDRFLASSYSPPSYVPAGAASDFRLMAQAWNLIAQDYVDHAVEDPRTLTYGAISGMVDALGDTGHSRFLSPSEVHSEQTFTSGTFEGIGAEVEMKDNQVVIAAPLNGSPAEKAGLQPGDIILKVDGVDVSGMSLTQVVNRILGKAGTSVTLTILRPATGVTQNVTIVRARIEVNNISWHMLPGTAVAHLDILAFSQGSTDNLAQALVAIQSAGAKGIILDLRDDPGGLLGEATGVASEFLPSGNVLLEKDAKGKLTPVPVSRRALDPNQPLVVLVNGETASAAEIVAGALQDAGRAALVGQTTYGTGTVLQEFPLADGSAVLLATQEWLTPKGRVIWHKGIQPNEIVTLPPSQQLLSPDGEQGLTPAELQSSGDTQLLDALKLLEQKLPSASH